AATLVAGGLALVAAMLAVAVPAVAHAIGGPIGAAIDWLRLPVAGLLMMVLWAALYHFLPNVHPKFQVVTPGSVIGVAVWLLASWGFSLYVRNFGKYDATYGTLGAVIVLLTWMYLSSQVVLVGAEINKLLTPAEDKAKIET